MTIVDRLSGVNSGVAMKAPVRLVADTNIALSGLQVIDGVLCEEGDRIAPIAQTDQTDRGIYVASTGQWERAKKA